MAKVTEIKKQQRRQDRFSVFVDEKYTLSLSQQELVDSGLKIGQEISKDRLTELKTVSDYGKLYDKVLNFLSYRPRSVHEVEQYLWRRKVDDDDKAKVLEQLDNDGYLDDLKFAEAWVNSRRALKPISHYKLLQELRQKRVSQDIIEQVLEKDEDQELEALKELIERKRRLSQYQDKTKLKAYLHRQGFSYDLIKRALDE